MKTRKDFEALAGKRVGRWIWATFWLDRWSFFHCKPMYRLIQRVGRVVVRR